MTAHGFDEKGWRAPAHHGPGDGLVRLGWFQFWLLIGILGGMLAMGVLVFFAYLSSL